jgi:hypothetical protein
MYVHKSTKLCDYFLAFVSLDMNILELGACCWCKLVHLIPMFTVDWICASLLKIWLFIDAVTFFPRLLFGLAVLV